MGTPKGKVFIDDGAAKALITRGSSLLPVGVEKIEGDFDRGDLLVCLNKEKEIAEENSYADYECAVVFAVLQGNKILSIIEEIEVIE